MVSEIKMDDLREKAVGTFTGGYMCSETLVYILNKYYDLGISEEAIAMSTGFPFGFGDGGNVCGAVQGPPCVWEKYSAGPFREIRSSRNVAAWFGN